jgi:VCBS repeat protein
MRRHSLPLMACAAATVLLAASEARAQFGIQWVGFANESSRRIYSDPLLGISDPEEKDYAWGDVDNDGDIDLVVVRKQGWTTPGKKPNVLFINEDGALVDRTAQYASDTDVPGDLGFLTATNDRDVQLADFNADGWLDIATGVTISDSDPKSVSHPRIYINKGAMGGQWLGFRFEQARSPQLYVLNSNGTPNFTKPYPGRFCSLAVGDVDDDGDIDIHLGDYDGEPSGYDINDRLWINDGNGFFSDSYQLRMNAAMTVSGFSAAAAIADMNGDGINDVVTQEAGSCSIAYNLPPDPVPFDLFDTPHAMATYFVSVGDLNNDNKLDMVMSEDGQDRYLLNQGNDALNRAIFSSPHTFMFPSGAGYGDDGFASESLASDLDNDGWLDVLIADVDVDIPGCGGRMHLYHNLGGTPGGFVQLREEAQQAGASSGWKGAVGIMPGEVTGTHYVAAFDIDNDKDKDLVVGRCNGTVVYINSLNPCPIVRYGSALPNSTGKVAMTYTMGTGDLSEKTLTISVRNLPPGALATVNVAPQKLEPCVPDGNGLKCIGNYRRVAAAMADAEGTARYEVNWNSPVFANLNPGAVRYLQMKYDDPGAGAGEWNWSEPVKITFCE